MSFRLSKYKDAISRPKPFSSFDMLYILLFPNYSEKHTGPSKYFLFNIHVVLFDIDHRSLR
jgi:hypothetical protein